MPASTLSGRSVALLRGNLDDCTSEGRLISHGNCTRLIFFQLIKELLIDGDVSEKFLRYEACAGSLADFMSCEQLDLRKKKDVAALQKKLAAIDVDALLAQTGNTTEVANPPADRG